MNERFELVKSNRLCINCFNPFHAVSDRKRSNCQTCNRKHHSLLHRETTSSNFRASAQTPKIDNSQVPPEPNASSGTAKASCCASTTRSKKVFLWTAVVKLRTEHVSMLARVLLDPASETTLITRNLCNRAKLTL